VKNIEKEAKFNIEIEYKPDLSDWSVKDLELLCEWMEAGEVGLPPESLHHNIIKYVYPGKKPIGKTVIECWT
jgi:hypothetical protein